MNCAKMAEPIELLFGVISEVVSRNHVLDGMHIGTTWLIRLNDCVQQMCAGLHPGILCGCHQMAVLFALLLLHARTSMYEEPHSLSKITGFF